MRRHPQSVSLVPTFSWAQFFPAFFGVGLAMFLRVGEPFDGLACHLIWTAFVASACGLLAGWFGPSAWQLFVVMF